MNPYQCQCVKCYSLTSRSYAKAHDGQCKSCANGGQTIPSIASRQTRDISNHPRLCPDCREHLLSEYQFKRGYHCDFCTREADPIGAYREMTEPYQGGY